jgi:hypothetical protein
LHYLNDFMVLISAINSKTTLEQSLFFEEKNIF